ncbi:conserved hypothetical protein [delta proteobacterium NaphS2]|nr:conserved hypothetical protein [delta proteobacterium NaphS2]
MLNFIQKNIYLLIDNVYFLHTYPRNKRFSGYYETWKCVCSAKSKNIGNCDLFYIQKIDRTKCGM